MTESFNSVLRDMLPYRDQHGLNQLSINGDGTVAVSDNGVLFTTEYLLVLEQSVRTIDDWVGLWAEADRVRQVFEACDLAPGIMRRAPGYLMHYDSMDNYVARLVFDLKFNKGQWARAMKEHGLKVRATGPDLTQYEQDNKKWYKFAWLLGLGRVRNYWNNMYPDKFCFFSWFGRSPGLMGLMDIAANGRTSLFRGFALWVGTVGGAFWSKPTDNDQWKLARLVFWAMRGRGWGWRLGERIWRSRLIKAHPNGMQGVYRSYYPAGHPIGEREDKT